jgi:hypothetical protein
MMKNRRFLWIVVLLFVPASYLVSSTWHYDYFIRNETEEDIFFVARVRPNNILKEKGYIEYIYHYEDGSEYPVILVVAGWKNDEIIKKHVSPDTNYTRIIAILPQTGKYAELIFIDGYDIIHAFFDEFVVYDGDGNIVLTMDDLQRGVSFMIYDKYDEAPWIPMALEYTGVLRITKEMMESGLRKYAGRKYNPEGNEDFPAEGEL